MVGGFDDVEVVFDDDDGVAGVDEFLQDLEQFVNVGEVEAGRWFVEDVDGLARRAFAQFFGELDALGLAARERGRRLADLDVAEADIEQSLQLLFDRRNVFEQGQSVFDGGVEEVGDREALEFDRERFAIVPVAAAHVAGDVHVGQEVHLDAFHAAAFASLAASAFDVKGKPAGFVTAGSGFGEHGVQLAKRRKQSRKGRRIRPRRTADRFLIDLDDLVHEIEAFDAVVLQSFAADGRFVDVLV